jgi:C4-dicarboxylate-specific signal transduction histidine kinase
VVSVDVARKKKQEEQDHQEEAIVSVEDNGSGINPEIFPRLFTPSPLAAQAWGCISRRRL